MAAGQHRDVPVRGCAVRRGIDAARSPDTRQTGIAEVARQRSANLTPAAEALREPTMAISGRAVASVPRNAGKDGGSSIICTAAR